MRTRVTLIEAFTPSQSPVPMDARPSGWLDPTGRYYSRRSHSSHGQWALAMGTSLGTLMKQGWVRVVMDGSTVWTTNPFQSPTPQQLRALKDAGIEHGWARLVHDSTTGSRVLWTLTEAARYGA